MTRITAVVIVSTVVGVLVLIAIVTGHEDVAATITGWGTVVVGGLLGRRSDSQK